jgi:hypothetical protein
MLELPAVGLQKLSKLSVCARVQYAEARRKLRPKSKNLQGKEAALTHTCRVAAAAGRAAAGCTVESKYKHVVLLNKEMIFEHDDRTLDTYL